MKIVVTDGYALNSGDLNWSEIEQLGQLDVYDRIPVELIVERCKKAEIILTNKVPIDKHTLQQLPQLKLINVLATGYNVIDIDAAKQKGVIVCNVPSYGTASVAQHSFALLLELTNNVGIHATSVANGEWQNAKDFSYTKKPIMELAEKTIGIVSFGNIGQQVAAIAKAFEMNILYNNPHKKDTSIALFANIKTLFANSDIVTLHCPLKADNTQFVNAALLQLMKPASMLINKQEDS